MNRDTKSKTSYNGYIEALWASVASGRRRLQILWRVIRHALVIRFGDQLDAVQGQIPIYQVKSAFQWRQDLRHSSRSNDFTVVPQFFLDGSQHAFHQSAITVKHPCLDGMDSILADG